MADQDGIKESVMTEMKDDGSIKSAPREPMIETAVKFLNNPKVVQSPISQKRAFLEKKGLTNAEIDIAVNRAGVPQNEFRAVVPSVINYQPPNPISRWSKFREIWYATVIIGGTVYGAYILTKKYIIPYLWGGQAEPDRISRLEKQMIDFHTHLDVTVLQLQKTIEELQTSVRETYLKQDNLLSLQNTAQSSKSVDNKFAELRAEIISLKGLLLNRHQFPTVPTITPIIPSWQMEKPEVNGETNDEDVQQNENESEA